MVQRIGRYRLGRLIAAIAIVIAGLAASRTGAQQIAAAPARYRAETGMVLLTGVEERDAPALSRLPRDQSSELKIWLQAGLSFEGSWTADQLTHVVRVLRAYADTYGWARFLRLLTAAVGVRSHGAYHHLRLVREEGLAVPAAGWYPHSARIALSDGLWDAEHVRAYHTWSFLDGPYADPAPSITQQEIIVAHEIGHVVINAMRAEAAAAGHPTLSVERLYGQFVPRSQWPHFDAHMNEHLATEIGVWVLGVSRTAEVDSFRQKVLQPIADGGGWVKALARRYPPPRVGR